MQTSSRWPSVALALRCSAHRRDSAPQRETTSRWADFIVAYFEHIQRQAREALSKVRPSNHCLRARPHCCWCAITASLSVRQRTWAHLCTCALPLFTGDPMTGLPSKPSFDVDLALSAAANQTFAAGRKQMERDANRAGVTVWVALAGRRACQRQQ